MMSLRGRFSKGEEGKENQTVVPYLGHTGRKWRQPLQHPGLGGEKSHVDGGNRVKIEVEHKLCGMSHEIGKGVAARVWLKIATHVNGT